MEGLRQLPDKSFDLCITDPPYGVNYLSNHYVTGKAHKFKTFDGKSAKIGKNGNPNPILENDDKFFFDWIPEIYRVLDDNAGIFVFSSHKVMNVWRNELEKYFTYKNTIIWIKNNFSMGDLYSNFADLYEVALYFTKGKYKLKGTRERNVVYADRIPAHVYGHSTPKPVECILKYIKTLKPINVIDPFAGTCFVGSACEQLGIPWLAYEKADSYNDSIIKRINEGVNKHKPNQKQQKLSDLF